MMLQKKLEKWIFKSNINDAHREGHMFPLCVKEQLDSWPEKDIRRREWVSLNSLILVVRFPPTGVCFVEQH